MHDNDPTRIPGMMHALQEAWEGQPDLTLPAFLGMLHNRGLSWATSEEEMRELLREVQLEHPSLMTAPPTAPTLVRTTSPQLSVTLFPGTVVVRRADDPQRMPSVWRYTHLRPTGPGRQLILTDEEGVEHHLGVVELVTVLDPRRAPELHGAQRRNIGEAQWLLMLDDATRAILGQRLRVWATVGRETQLTTLAWSHIERFTVGRDIVVAPAGGGAPLVLGPVAEVLLLET